jgi:type II secretory pathway pseudopilin PulG
MKKTNKAGFTIMELIVALAAACIIVFAAGIVLVFGQRSWDRGLEQAGVQRDASFAMLRMKQSISAGRSVALDADGMGVKIFNSTGWIKYRFYPGQKDLRYQIDGQSEQTLLGGIVRNAAFDVDPNTHKMVIIDIELQKHISQTRLSSKTMMRNYGS